MRRMYPLLAGTLLALLLAGCGANANHNGAAINAPPTSSGSPTFSQEGTETAVASGNPSPTSTEVEASGNHTPDMATEDLQAAAQEIVESLRERDLSSLSKWIHPDRGLRFSPYSHLNSETDLVFTAETLPTFKDTEKLIWGSADGTGDPIELSFREYFEKFVYSQDFAEAPDLNVNKIMGVGNAEFNGKQVYPEASFVEFYFSGFDKQYEGMDWQSLTLLLEPLGEEWRLVAIVHGQWTI